ncbi:ICMT-domain-containing protein [Teratosphaeria nubilosa]|uniref:Protein-S-isoprenylcysteine O-methyltransferase n=1 Tax=Teratosphaeria nubilosa TaxID=161662 RepID=A0A6G1L581_9PEZI|nr:ICMT-domain-containing protein [Teratosphaeria nubilosa]
MARLSASNSATGSNGNATSLTPVQRSDAEKDEESSGAESEFDWNSRPKEKNVPTFDPSLLPTGSRSLTAIALQASSLGFVLAACILSTMYWTYIQPHPIWRFPAFFACLSIFHFLEFYTTAAYNLPALRASSFLLYNNGWAYNVAHGMAATEVLLSVFVLPESYRQALVVPPWTIALGVIMVVVGQGFRSIAMAQAGTNFNHLPQRHKKDDHVLVTKGVYNWFRHPSYFGFFWWALGTQVLVGNKVCLLGYAGVLWHFFWKRIIAEEKSLVRFFGQDYQNFKKTTSSGIPFVR